MLIAPELFLTGHRLGAATTSAMAEPADGPSAAAIAAIARRHHLAILYGYPERAGDKVYNAAQLIDQDGRRLANYRKTHLFGDIDRTAFAACDELVVQAELAGVVFGILIG